MIFSPVFFPTLAKIKPGITFPFWEQINILVSMRVIAIKTLIDYIEEFQLAEQALLSWHEEAVLAQWNNPNEFKAQYNNASILNELEPQFEKAMESVNTFFKEENDYLYRRGAAKKSHSIVENLILKLGLTDEQAADVAEVDTDYVKKVRAELKK